VLIDSGKNAEWWNIRFEPVQDEFGDTVSVAYSAANINKEKRQVEEINKKNESLLNIAYIQSHLYRKPLASILGLMNVIKENNYESPRECLLLMEKAVNELDKQIKSVVQHSQMEAS
jgi:signal transduction histidine kinase